MKKLISQGAEAKIFLVKDKIVKDRIPKGYRHKQLDKQIRTRRTRSEAKILTKALSFNINVPQVLNTDKHTIHLQHIEGDRLSETLNSYPEKKQFKIMQQLGEQTALLHKNNIIHGDLTTSNTILATKPIPKIASQNQNPASDNPSPKPCNNHKCTEDEQFALVSSNRQSKDDKSKLRGAREPLGDPNIIERSSTKSPAEQLYIIDFGLGFISTKIEDKAVDLHLIKQALEAKHFQNHEELFKNFLKTYKDEEVIKRLEVVEKRGRYKH